jgi:N-acyl-D-aspartate/D-glutamate deacylase
LVGRPEERAAKLRDGSVREAMKSDVEDWPNFRTDWSRVSVLQVAHERNYKYEGVTIQALAEMTGKQSLDAFLDLALDEDLETEFLIPPRNSPDELEDRSRQLADPYSHISVSDGGAHTRFLTIATWPVEWLSFWVRDREIMTLEQAHYKMSAYPAWFTDFKDRGTLRVGSWADIMVYNLDELGYLYDKPVYANDFPGGERRLIQKPSGLRYTIVNGSVTFEGNEPTGLLPGKLLRSRDMVS